MSWPPKIAAGVGSGGAGVQRGRGAGEQGSRGAGEQGSRGAGEQGSRGAGEQGRSRSKSFPSAPLPLCSPAQYPIQ
ncbi:hypothetical protein [Nostoc sp.]|uniref:hypothetical protein n=1 Tax=Nostoc sp. TaxID=1180 RepID=UPI002FFC4803